MKSLGILCCCAVLALSLDAAAQASAPSGGALERIKQKGVVRIGYRANAAPFSSAGPNARPQGYSIDLCHAIVEDLSAAMGGKSLRTEYALVTTEDRLDLLVRGHIDLECGATTETSERSDRVAFSPTIFVAGTRLVVKRGESVHSLRDLSGKTVGTVTGTTNQRAMLTLGSGRVPNLRVTAFPSYGQAFAALSLGEVDALAADDILIMGFLESHALRDRYIMVGDPLTQDLYGITFQRDPALADAVKVTFARLAASRELRSLYDKWFQPLGLPMGAYLESIFQGLGLPAR